MSIADDKLNAAGGRGARGGSGPLAGLRAQYPMLAAVLLQGAHVAAWIAFYIVVRALTG